MSLKRRDVRLWLDPEDHDRLTVLCEFDNVELSAYLEQILVPAIRRRCSEAIGLSERLRERGISREGAE